MNKIINKLILYSSIASVSFAGHLLLGKTPFINNKTTISTMTKTFSDKEGNFYEDKTLVEYKSDKPSVIIYGEVINNKREIITLKENFGHFKIKEGITYSYSNLEQVLNEHISEKESIKIDSIETINPQPYMVVTDYVDNIEIPQSKESEKNDILTFIQATTLGILGTEIFKIKSKKLKK